MKDRIAARALVTAAAVVVSALIVGGCARSEPAPPVVRPQATSSMFAADSMRLHPTFTRLRNWTNSGTGRPDGIEVELEFSDKFGDPVKAEGRAIFELYEYRTDTSDVRGQRVTTPFVGSLLTEGEQRARWNGTTRTYSFRLAYANLSSQRTYVLTATFEPKAGGRFYSRIILQPTPPVSGQ